MSNVRRFLGRFTLFEKYTDATFTPESIEVDGITFRTLYPLGSPNKVSFELYRDLGYLYLLPEGNLYIVADKPFDNCDFSDRVSISFNPFYQPSLNNTYDENNSGKGEDLITKYHLPKNLDLRYFRHPSTYIAVANFSRLFTLYSEVNQHYRLAISKLERLFENSDNLEEELTNYIDDNLVIPLIKFYKLIYSKVMNPELLKDVIKGVKAFNEVEIIESMELKEDLNKVIYGQGWTIRKISANWYGEHDLLKINANGTYDFRKYYSKGANYPWARFPSEEKAEAFFNAMKLEPDLYEVTKCKKPKYMILQDSKYAVYKTLPEKPYGYSDDQIGYIDDAGNVGETPSIPKSVLGSNEKLAKYIFNQLEDSILFKAGAEIKSPEKTPSVKGKYEVNFLGYGNCVAEVKEIGNSYGLKIQNKYEVLYRDSSAVISEIYESVGGYSYSSVTDIILNNYPTTCYEKYLGRNDTTGEKVIVFRTLIPNYITVNNLYWELEEKNLIPEALKNFDGTKLTKEGAEKINLFIATCKKNSSVLIDFLINEASKAYKEGSKDYFPAVKDYIENFTEVVVIENYARDTLYDLYDDKWDEE